jgi:diguanylate cyclase (GGDEF)-like protein
LEDTTFLGESLHFLSAYSAQEAKAVLAKEHSIALIFLDVVMETDDAGLLLIEHIRNVMNNWLVRIVLRTGQSGQAPERQVITEYDINDYKAKTELTVTRLFTTTLVSLRTYKQLCAVELNRKGLERILEASATLFEYRSMAEFARGVVLQISSFIDCSHGVMLCAISEQGKGQNLDNICVIASTENSETVIGAPIKHVISASACALIQQALLTGNNIYTQYDNAVVFKTHSQASSVIYIAGVTPLNLIDRKLLEVFCSKLAIGFDNTNYYEQLQYKNKHDLLTGLFNRSTFIEKIDDLHSTQQQVSKFASLLTATATPPNAVLLVLGIDRFKDINTDLGYQTGDAFLQLIAKRLKSITPANSIIARLGADEFAVYMPQVENVLATIERLRISLNQTVMLNEQEFISAVSIGYAIVVWDRPCYDLLSLTETALLSAKRTGGNRCIQARAEVIKDNRSRLSLTRELTYALSRKELAMYYQPIIHSQSGRLAGFEALLRWNHPEYGITSPGEFLDLIEPTDLMLPLGDWVLRETIEQTQAWNTALDYQLQRNMSLNVN